MALTKVDKSVSSTPGIVDNSDATAITIDSSENVGIGATSPASKLHISATGEARLILEGDSDNDSGEESSLIEFRTDGGAVRHRIEATGSGGNDLKITAGADQTTSTLNSEIIFETKTANSSTAERMRIDADGNVGIGVSSIVREPLQVHRASTSDVQIHMTNSATGTSASDGMTIFSNSTTSGFWQRESANMLFAIAGSERMRIDSSGNFLVGTTTAIVSSHTIVKDSGVPLSLKRLTNASSQNSLLLGYGTGGSTANIQVRGNGDVRNTNGTFTTISSDRRTKENIADATGKLADLCKLSVKNFYYKDQPHEGKQIGFIADEMIDIFPSLVTEEDTREYDADGNVVKGYADQKGIKVGGIGFAILTKAIQEQQAIIEDLQTQINEVKNGN